MWPRFRQWLSNIPVHDPVERQVAPLVQFAELSGITMTLLGMIAALLTPGSLNEKLAKIALNAVVLLVTGGGWLLLRRGKFVLSVAMVAVVVLLSLTINTLSAGLRSNNGMILVGFAVPIVMTSLLVGRRGLVIVLGISIAIVVGTAILQNQTPPLAGWEPAVSDPTIPNIIGFVLTWGLLSLFLDRFGTTLRVALNSALRRERDLEQAQMSLSEMVAAQTASLQQALLTSEQREQRLAETVEELRASQLLVRELSAPILPVLQGVLVAPLVGALDAQRAQALTANVLAAVEGQHAHHVIFDVTGVPTVDTQVAHMLLQTAAAARLLGAQPLLVGVRPEVAQSVVMHSHDLHALPSYPNLQEAIEVLLPHTQVALR